MIIFYTTHCPRCNVLKKKLDANGINYKICEDVEEMAKLGMKAAPALNVDGTMMMFESAIRWANNLTSHKEDMPDAN